MSTDSYHHGGLHAAMLEVAERILETDGPEGLTLRAAARAAGVSHAAPRHHFGDLTGLLSELAAVGYVRFANQLAAAADAAGDTAPSRLKAIGLAYVRFARAHPNLFLLMFRSQRLDKNRASLRSASEAAFAVLRDAVGKKREGVRPAPSFDARAEAIAAWSLVHGFAMLMIDGRLPQDTPTDALLEAVLKGRGR
jgi:AcrR family transcriptional regulator